MYMTFTLNLHHTPILFTLHVHYIRITFTLQFKIAFTLLRCITVHIESILVLPIYYFYSTHYIT